MDEFIEDYRKLSPDKKIFAELLFYSFIAFQTKNDSAIRINKGRINSIAGKKAVKYEIEVPVND